MIEIGVKWDWLLINYYGPVNAMPRARSYRIGFAFTFLSLILLAGSQITRGQQSLPTPEPSASPKKAAPSSVRIKRWFELDTLAISLRYRHIANNVNLHAADVGQFQFQAKGHFKFDSKGKYSVYAGVYTGNSIESGWGSTGWGTGKAVTNLFVKQLYFQAKPVKELEVQFGSIAPNNGENTEVTGYDNDIYLMGERITIKAPRHLYFDEISATNAHFGDFRTPSVFRRFDGLDKSNYHQFLVRKKVNKNVTVSADYTFEAGRDTFRQAVKFSIPGFRIFDLMRFENYQRIDPEKDYGFGIYGEKTLRKRLLLYSGFSRIDTPMVNGDRYGRGNRIYGGWNLKMTREFTFSGILLQGIGPLPAANTPRTRFEAIVTFNILETLRRFKIH